MPALKRILALAALLAALCLLPGCFDYTVEFTLKSTGKGTLAITLAQPRPLAGERNGGLKESILFPPAKFQTSLKGSRLVAREVANFDWIDVLVVHRVKFEVEEVGTGLMGLTARTYRFKVRLETVEGDLPDRRIRPGTELETPAPSQETGDPAAQRARQLLAGVMGGHYVTIALNLPGELVRTWPVALGTAQIQPQVEAEAGKVRWRLPVGRLMGDRQRRVLHFMTEFKGRLEFRGPVQRQAWTRYPTKVDEIRFQKRKAQEEEDRRKREGKTKGAPAQEKQP